MTNEHRYLIVDFALLKISGTNRLKIALRAYEKNGGLSIVDTKNNTEYAGVGAKFEKIKDLDLNDFK
jgi:hypothetical protein